MNQIRITSDGSITGTWILDADTAEDLTSRLRVQSMTIMQSAGDIPRATLVCIEPDIDLVVRLEEIGVRIVERKAGDS